MKWDTGLTQVLVVRVTSYLEGPENLVDRLRMGTMGVFYGSYGVRRNLTTRLSLTA